MSQTERQDPIVNEPRSAQQSGGYLLMVLGLFFMVPGIVLALVLIFDGGGKAEEAFNFLGLAIGLPGFVVGGAMFTIGIRRGQ